MGNFITFGLGGSDIDDFILFDLSPNDGAGPDPDPVVVSVILPTPVSYNGPADGYASLQRKTSEFFIETLDKDWESQGWSDE